MPKFDSKSFNPQAFGKYVERVPNTKKNELVKSKALRGNSDIRDAFSSQTTTSYARLPYFGKIGKGTKNYDGQTDITSNGSTTFERGIVVIGRADAWTEKDFSFDITAGVDFMDNVAQQVAEYWTEVDQDTILSILKGIFAMSGTGNLKFVNNHTYDISNAGSAENQVVGQTTLNNALQKASGDNKSVFTLALMHSQIATNLENLKLLKYYTYTDAEGVERQLTLASWNGRAVLIDDSMPVAEVVSTAPVYSTTISTAATAGDKITINGTEYTFVANDASDTGNKIKVGSSGTASQQATNIAAKVTISGFTITASSTKVVFTAASGTNPDAPDVSATKVATTGTLVVTNATDTAAVTYNKYTTYVLGEGAFDYEDIGAKVPYEMARDPKTNGGEDTLYSRQRKVFAPAGISYEKTSQASLSPTDSELENGANWSLVNNGEAGANLQYWDHKAIPIARIISRG